jgi:hypothetical protein
MSQSVDQTVEKLSQLNIEEKQGKSIDKSTQNELML